MLIQWKAENIHQYNYLFYGKINRSIDITFPVIHSKFFVFCNNFMQMDKVIYNLLVNIPNFSKTYLRIKKNIHNKYP